MATTALVLGIVGVSLALVPFGFAVAAPLSLAALVLGIFGLRASMASGAPRGRATAGIILGGLGLLASALMYQACVGCHRGCGGSENPYRLTSHCWNNGDCRAWDNAHGIVWCVEGRCVQCRDDRDCAADTYKHCVAHHCEMCVADGDCAGSADGPYCNERHYCGACRGDADCKDSDKPHCLNQAVCVRCWSDDQCPQGQSCAADDDNGWANAHCGKSPQGN
jgi:hypothetical protein